MGFPIIARIAQEEVYQQYVACPGSVGNLAMDDFGSLYRLCYAVDAHTAVDYPMGNGNSIPTDGAEAALTAAAVGATEVTVADTTAAASRPVDYYKGGFAYFYGASTAERQQRRIVGSTVGDGSTITVTLDAPLTVAITGGTGDLYPSPYGKCKTSGYGQDYITWVCYPRLILTAARYFWGLVRGPCNGHYRSSYPGTAVRDKDVYFDQKGTISTAPDINGGAVGTTSPQRAGYVLPYNAAAYGSCFFMLQLE